MKDFGVGSCPKKRYVQGHVYGIACEKGVASNIVILPGPSPEEPIELAKSIANTSKSRIYCVESDIDVYYDEIEPYYNKLPKHLQEKIKIKYGNIENHKVHRVMDLDLCKTLKVTSLTIRNCLREQALDKSKRIKCLMSTVSLRGCSIQESFRKLDNILKEIGTETLLSSSTKTKNSWTVDGKHVFNEWKPMISKYGRLLVTDGLHIYTYKDGKKSPPMMTCLIMYR